MLISSFAEAYHWPLDRIFQLTLPQIIMMSHASHVNGKRMEERVNKKSSRSTSSNNNFDFNSDEPHTQFRPPKDFDPVVMNGEKLSEVQAQGTDKMVAYLAPLLTF